ncbi:hypothetical protein NDI96_13515 [Vibrio alginolyticus]|nr:hypothetical protein [Vibrio alginolyticus]MCS0181375.1 hypothetical protein [Vibrio alginolyticus]
MNEQDAKPTCMVSDVTKDTVQVVADEACKAATAKYGVTKLTSPMLIF